MARRSRKAEKQIEVAQATIKGAEINSRGVVLAAKLQATAVVAAAIIGGTCAVLGVGVQGHFAVEQARIAASARPSIVPVPVAPERNTGPLAPDFEHPANMPGQVIGGTLTEPERNSIQHLDPKDRARVLLTKRLAA